ncbi:MAG: NTP/NDP exchange transporter [Polyangia bacterium]
MAIRSRIERVVDIRPGEGARTALMFFTILLLIAAYTTTKAVRDAVFLSKFGLTELSYMYIGIAIVAGIFVTAYKRLTSGMGRNVVALVTNGFIALTLVAMAVGLQLHVKWISWGLYFWSGVFGLVLVAEFWLLANDLFDAREAKRLFPIIGGGAILGGLFGGTVPGWLAKPLGAGNLLYIVAVELVVSAFLSHLAWKRRRPEVQREVKEAPPPKFAEGLAILRRNRYVRLISLMLLCMTVCYTIVQWQYKGIAKIHYAGRQDDMAAFFGMFAAVLNLATFVLQILGTPRLLRRWGVGFGLRVLPTGFGLGALALVATMILPIPMLGAAAVAMLLCDGFRFSVDKASMELLYLPIPRAVKDQAKPFIDTFVDRVAGALASFLWLFLTWAFHVDRPDRIVYASIATLATAMIWLFVIQRAKNAYIAAYRKMLGAGEVEAGQKPRVAANGRLRGRVLEELDKLGSDDTLRRGKRLRGIARLTRRSSDLKLPPETIAGPLSREADAVQRLSLALQSEAATLAASTTKPPLVSVLHARRKAALERMFSLLTLSYPRADVRAAESAILSESPTSRAGALELLDNVLRGSARSLVMDSLEPVVLPRRGMAPCREQTLAALLALDDAPLRRDVARAARADGILTEELSELATRDPDPAVRRAATALPPDESQPIDLELAIAPVIG